MGQPQKVSIALILPSRDLITPLPVNALHTILAANVPNKIGRNPRFCSFTSSLIVSTSSFY